MFDAHAAVVLAIDGDSVVVYANPAAIARWPTCDGALASSLVPFTRGAQPFEWGEQGAGGVRAWFHATVSPLEGVGHVIVSTDITEHKRSEMLMVDTHGVAHLGTWDWDVSQPNATWSEELYKIYGLTPETYTPSYEAYLTMVHPDDRQRVIDATNRVFNEHVPYSHDERISRPDGSIRWLHTWAYPVLDGNGKLLRLIGVCQDITDRHLAEEQVRQLNVELEQRVVDRTKAVEVAMRDLEAFNAMISHDLRAPISVIQLCIDLIAKDIDQLPPRVATNVERIRRAGGLMANLVDDLMRLASVGQSPLVLTDIDVSALCGELFAELQKLEPDRRVEISVEPAMHWRADVGMVRSALANLLGNAWKYTARVALPRIEVSTRDGVLVVRDNGAGFDMKDAHRLFAPFERLHDASQFSGTGVGLATVQRIVERHGGKIWAESSPEQGATFFVEIPR